MTSKTRVVRLLAILLVAGLAVGAFAINLQGTQQTAPLAASAAVDAIGGTDWGCGLLVGAVGGTIGLIAGGVTIGFGAALVISATIHVAAVACAS